MVSLNHHNTTSKGGSLMRSIHQMQLESNSKIRLDFNGGELSSDSGLFLVNEFCWKLGLNALAAQDFHTTDNALFRIHQDH